MNSRRYVLVGLALTIGVALAAGGLRARNGVPSAAAQVAGGTITGQVLWCAPLPYGARIPGVEGEMPPAATATPDDVVVPPEVAPGAGGWFPYPQPPRMIPAGAVLVAVQGTALSTRTDEDGSFTITDVPVGSYLTVAAGPVARMNGAFALRPNVHVAAAGETVDVGMLTLSQPCDYYGPVPYAVPPTVPAEPGTPE